MGRIALDIERPPIPMGILMSMESLNDLWRFVALQPAAIPSVGGWKMSRPAISTGAIIFIPDRSVKCTERAPTSLSLTEGTSTSRRCCLQGTPHSLRLCWISGRAG